MNEATWNNISKYFLISLPSETDEKYLMESTADVANFIITKINQTLHLSNNQRASLREYLVDKAKNCAPGYSVTLMNIYIYHDGVDIYPSYSSDDAPCCNPDITVEYLPLVSTVVEYEDDIDDYYLNIHER